MQVVPAEHIREQYRRFKALYPDVAKTIKTFNEYKREIPPRALPDFMNDHKLDGALKGIKECHLAPDVLLLYTHKDDVVRMLFICTHDDLYGKRARQIKAQISALTKNGG